MIEKTKNLDAIKNNKGITAVFVLFVLFGLVGVTALAIDIGHLATTKNELQNVADAAALAGAGHLGSIYLTLPVSEQSTHTFTLEEVAAQINEVAEKNSAAGVNISIAANEEDIVIGNWKKKDINDPNSEFEVKRNYTGPDAVKVTARRDGKMNSPITTFFATIFGIDTENMSADATAALTGPSKVAPGELDLPFALSEYHFPNNCTSPISFSPTSTCSGFHNYDFGKTNTDDITETMLGLIQGHINCDYCGSTLNTGPTWLEDNYNMTSPPPAVVPPEVSVGDMFYFSGQDGAAYLPNVNSDGQLGEDYDDEPSPGNIGTIIPNGSDTKPAPFPNLFDYFRYRDGDGDNTVWTTTIPVYKDPKEDADIDKCGNPSGQLEIVGFASIVVERPNGPPDKDVEVTVECEMSVIEGRGGGGTYGGLKGSIPNLVE